jgi:hypothetical protein
MIPLSNIKNIVSMRFLPEHLQLALALLRVCTGATLFLRHAWEK